MRHPGSSTGTGGQGAATQPPPCPYESTTFYCFLVFIELTIAGKRDVVRGMKKKTSVVMPVKARKQAKKGKVRPYDEAKKGAGVGGYY